MIDSARSCPATGQRGQWHHPSIKLNSLSSCPYRAKKVAVEPQTLAQEIYAFTRKTHNELTTLLTALLPLSLPPYTSSPQTYATGLLPIALIYNSFETLLVRSFSNPDLPPQILSVLETLYIPALLRSQRIKSDICTLLAISPPELESTLSACQTDATLPSLRQFLRHIDCDVTRRPYTLTAYAYVLYNALFNGGCWMRAQLKSAEKSWTQPEYLPSQEEIPRHLPLEAHNRDWGLRFWHFDPLDPHDWESSNEDDGSSEKPGWTKLDPAATALKAEFKARVEQVQGLVTFDQRQDIIQEAKTIFDSMKAIVLEMAATGEYSTGKEKHLAKAGKRSKNKRHIKTTAETFMTVTSTSRMWIHKTMIISTPLSTRLLSALLPFWLLNLLLAFSWSCLSLLASRFATVLRPRLPHLNTLEHVGLESLRREET